MKYSQEIENQLNELADIDKKILLETTTIIRNQILISITIDKSLLNFSEQEPLDIIRFFLILKPTYPDTPPLLYCVSKFCVPPICDGRDLLEEVLQMKWNKEIVFLKLIISLIPPFIGRYMKYIKNLNSSNELIIKREMFGKFYLDSLYESSILKFIPYLYFNPVLEVVGNDKEYMNVEDRVLILTDNFLLLFCTKSLYDIDKLRLIFVGPITSLIYIKQYYADEIVYLKWISKGKDRTINNKFYELQLKTGDGDYIVDTLIDNLSKSSIKFKVTNKVNGVIKREGTVPLVEINLVEEEIKNLEKKIRDKEDVTKESISTLISLYEKAIQYHSALNNQKFEIYIKKTHDIYSNNEYTSLLNMKTISSANNSYNVTQFKRKRKKKGGGDESEGKKKKEKKTKKKLEQKNENIDINNNNENIIKEEDKKEINKVEEKKEDLKDKNDDKQEDIKDINNIINENEKMDDKESKPKRSLKKREEGGKTLRKNRNKFNENNNFSKMQKMDIDKKEIEEMLKSELNLNKGFGDIIKDDKEKKEDINK